MEPSSSAQIVAEPAARAVLPIAGAGRERLSMMGELSWGLDPLAVVGAASLVTLVQAHGWLAAAPALPGSSISAWFVALCAPWVLRDPRFGVRAGHAQWHLLLHSFALRWALLVMAILLWSIGTAPVHGPGPELLWWLTATVAATTLTRLAVVAWIRHRQRQGHLREVVAVVGAGTLADRLVDALHLGSPRDVELLGIFDDRTTRTGTRERTGDVAQLIELGKTRRIDCIVLTLPATAEQRLLGTVQRLKALAAPIGLCPHDFDLAPAFAPGPTYTFDALDLASFAPVAANWDVQRCGYVVTPNADHLIRLHDDASFRTHYAAADFVLLDSRFVAKLLGRLRNVHVPVCTGSDLTAHLFDTVIGPDDALVLIGGSDAQACALTERHGLRRLVHHNPPMGFIRDAEAVEACLRFVEAHSPFRFCLLAVGSPQQEALAQALKVRGTARGLVLCVGASIDFLTGVERRAPQWMQRAGVEWLFRLLQAPERMASRYLIRGPRVFALLRRAQIVLRRHDPVA